MTHRAPSLHLTLDDGPDPTGTPLVLEALARHNARATFFVLGAAVREHAQVLEQVLAAGHRVELHGDAHLDHRYASAQELLQDTERAIEGLAAHGITPSWWRLPWGRSGHATAALAERFDLRIVGWDLDTHDWRGDGWDDQPALAPGRLADGDVVLMHDGIGPGATRPAYGNTVGLIDGLAAVARDRGLRLVELPDARDESATSITEDPGPFADLVAPTERSA